jgi:hypothetical protein
MTELIERADRFVRFTFNAANCTCNARIQLCIQSYVGENETGEGVSPADSERWISENYSIINSVENRQGAEKLSIHRSRALR